jgi:hypothetical protein
VREVKIDQQIFAIGHHGHCILLEKFLQFCPQNVSVPRLTRCLVPPKGNYLL